MSDIIRSYSGYRHSGNRRIMRRRQQRKTLLRILLAAVLLLILLCLWSTRNSYSLAGFIAKEQACHWCAPDFLHRREAIAASTTWDVLPDNSPLKKIHRAMGGNFGKAEWLINNIFQGPVHVVCQDPESFRDVVLATYMSRTGSIAEKIYRFLPGVKNHRIDNVKLTHLVNEGLYYVVRGRALLVSPSAEALARALNLSPDQAIGEAALESITNEARNCDALCVLSPTSDQKTGALVREARIALRWLPGALRLSADADLSAAWKLRLTPLFKNAPVTSLRVPHDGPLAFSCNFAKQLPALWSTLDIAFGDLLPLSTIPEQMNALWGAAEPWPTFIPALARQLGPDFTLTWCGIDQNAIFPTPELVGQFACPAGELQPMMMELPPSSGPATPEDSTPCYDPEKSIVYIPTIGAPAFQPMLALRGDDVFFSTSHTQAQHFLPQPAREDTLPQPANLYVRLQPKAALQALYDAAEPFAQMGMIRGYDASSFTALAEPWLTKSSMVHDVAAYLSYVDEHLQCQIEIEMASKAPTDE